MKIINKIPESKPTRYISTCYPSEAFKINNEWYTLIQSNFDQVINSTDEQVEKFIDGHVHCHSGYYDLLPCIELSTMYSSFLTMSPSRNGRMLRPYSPLVHKLFTIKISQTP